MSPSTHATADRRPALLRSAGFLLLNSLFGSLGGELFANRPPPTLPTMDPAFTERLKKAKEFREEHGGNKAG